MQYPTLDSLSLKGKRVFCRVDFNVSLDEEGNIRDDARIQAALPTIQYLIAQEAKVILASHLGRPKGTRNKKFTLLPAAARLAELLGQEVLFPDDCVGMEVKKHISEMKEGDVILLENLRFHKEEEENNETFSRQLADLADVYVTDAFGALHRAHASTVGMVSRFKEKAIGRLVEKEVNFLSQLLFEPQRPFVVVLGGAKVSDKILVIERLMQSADKIIIGGGMAYTFLLALGHDVGKSLVEENKVALAKKMINRAETKGVELLLPVDHIIASSFDNGAQTKTVSNVDDWSNWMGLDIGPKTEALFRDAIQDAKMVFWNGPMGVYEMENFQKGTLAVAQAMADCSGVTVVGGGDSLAAVKQTGLGDRMAHLSTGGGASLKFLEGEDLPGLKVIQ